MCILILSYRWLSINNTGILISFLHVSRPERFSKCSHVPFLEWLLTAQPNWGCLCCRNSMTRICKLEWLEPASPSPYLAIQRNGLISKTAEQPATLIGVHGNCWMFSTFEKSGHLCKQLIVAVRAQLQHLVLQGLNVALPRHLSRLGICLALTADLGGALSAVYLPPNPLQQAGARLFYLFHPCQGGVQPGAVGLQLLSVIWRQWLLQAAVSALRAACT